MKQSFSTTNCPYIDTDYIFYMNHFEVFEIVNYPVVSFEFHF